MTHDSEGAEQDRTSPKQVMLVFEATTGKTVRWNQASLEVTGLSNEEISQARVPETFFFGAELELARQLMTRVNRSLAQHAGAASLFSMSTTPRDAAA